MDFEVGIIGAGAAGLSAAIYSARAGMSTVVFEMSMSGGQTVTSPEIENYPGFPRISGPELMEKMKEHATEYADIKEYEKVEKVEVIEGGFRLSTGEAAYRCKALIMATGAHHRKLDVPGEQEFNGMGVSYCATCDGNFFKGKKALVVGGGNSAATEALYLHGVGVEVEMVHRRDRLRAEDAMAEELKRKNVLIHWNTAVRSIEGEMNVNKAVLESTVEGGTREVECAGVFIAIGVIPSNDLAKSIGVALDDSGYILVDRMQRTNVPGVYAAGDITGGLRQIVTGAAEGAQAALTATEATGRAYPF